MEFLDSVVSRGGQEWPALSVAPVSDSRLDEMRLEALRTGEAGSIDHAILNAVQERHGDVRLVVFRGMNDLGTARWAFAPGLDPAHDAELGYWLVRTQLPTYRALTKLGVMMLAHIELGPREVAAFRDGTRRLLDEVVADREAGQGGADADRDVWILSNLTTFYEKRFGEMMGQVLPAALARIEARMRRVPTMT